MVAILGSTGINFGAGLTGGLAWVFDEDGRFLKEHLHHADFLMAEPYDSLDAEAQESIRKLIATHAEKTGSTRAKWLLSEWERFSERFVRLTPKPQA
ncbi:MAG TPA: hypothetical protein VHT24_15045 [Pseudacidobacterium sp.]|jgi:glutamate synthase (NADPH/NADH) large chain|nr:hypothetical protein [Pseudacidobacterium sp.]